MFDFGIHISDVLVGGWKRGATRRKVCNRLEDAATAGEEESQDEVECDWLLCWWSANQRGRVLGLADILESMRGVGDWLFTALPPDIPLSCIIAPITKPTIALS